MSDCEKFQEMISAMLDGELSPEETDELHAHLESCAECKRMYDAFAALEDTLENDMVEPPAELADGVMFRIRNSTPAKKRRPRVMRYVAAAACVVVVAAAAIGSGLFSGAKSSENAAPMMMQAAGGAPEISDGSLFGVTTESAAAEPQEAPAAEPKAKSDAPAVYGLVAGVNADEDTDEVCEAECERFDDSSDKSASVPQNTDISMELCFDGIVYCYVGHTAVLPEGARASDAGKLTDYYSGKAVIGNSPEIGLFFRTETELYVPDGNGEWDCYSLEE